MKRAKIIKVCKFYSPTPAYAGVTKGGLGVTKERNNASPQVRELVTHSRHPDAGREPLCSVLVDDKGKITTTPSLRATPSLAKGIKSHRHSCEGRNPLCFLCYWNTVLVVVLLFDSDNISHKYFSLFHTPCGHRHVVPVQVPL